MPVNVLNFAEYWSNFHQKSVTCVREARDVSLFVPLAISSVQLLKPASQSNTCSPSKGSSATTLHSYSETRLRAEQTKRESAVTLDSYSEFGDQECEEDKIPGGNLTQARFKKMPWMKYSGRHSVLVR